MHNGVSLVITSYSDPEGLHLTVFGVLEQLEKAQLDWEIILVCDGGTPIKWENIHPAIRCFRLTGANRAGSPQRVRDIGIRNAQYEKVLCIDSHVIVSDIQEWAAEHERLDAAISFPAMNGVSGDMWKIFGNATDWDGSFWYKHTFRQARSNEPYRVLYASQSAFMCSREFFMNIDGFKGIDAPYGSEEPYLPIKGWMLGYQMWLIPSIWHAHYQPTGRNAGIELTDGYKQNFAAASYILGGQKYLQKTESFYNTKLKITEVIQKERQKVCAGPYHGDLDALRQYCKENGVE